MCGDHHHNLGICLHYCINDSNEQRLLSCWILSSGKYIVAIEVKSGTHKYTAKGLEDFCKEFKVKRQLLVGEQGISLSEFLATSAEKWLA